MLATIELFEALKTRFGESEAKIIVQEIEKIETRVDTKVEQAITQKAQVFKDDIKSLKEHIDLTFATREDLANTKVDIIRWMVTLIIGLFIALLSSIAAIMKMIVH